MKVIVKAFGGLPQHAEAEITTEHAFSSYGQPVMILRGRHLKKQIIVDPLALQFLEITIFDATESELKSFQLMQRLSYKQTQQTI